MPRGPRLDAPGMVHHVWARALDGRDLFIDRDDREDIVARFSKVLPEGGASCFGWTLMSNHVHLVLKTAAERLGTLMQRIFTGYAMRFNGRSGRRGYLLQGRFGSRPVRDDGDLLGVIRYVLRNPLEAGLVRSLDALEGYPWGAYSALVERREAHAFESVAATLRLFGSDEAAGRHALRAWLERPAPAAAASPLDALIRTTCAELGIDEGELREGRRTRAASRALALICERALRQAGLRVTDVARALGLCHAAVSQAARRAPGGERK